GGRASAGCGPPAWNCWWSRIAIAARRWRRSTPSCLARRCSVRSGKTLALKQFERGGVDALVAGRDDAAATIGLAIVPGGDDAAGAADDGHQWEHVVRLEFGLDHEVDVAGGEHAIGVAVSAIAREPHRLLDLAEQAAIGAVHERRAGGEQPCLRQVSAGAYSQIALAGRSAVVCGTAVAAELFAGERLVHHPEYRHAQAREGDQGSPHRHSSDE